jgi:hypothetical protein
MIPENRQSCQAHLLCAAERLVPPVTAGNVSPERAEAQTQSSPGQMVRSVVNDALTAAEAMATLRGEQHVCLRVKGVVE